MQVADNLIREAVRLNEHGVNVDDFRYQGLLSQAGERLVALGPDALLEEFYRIPEHGTHFERTKRNLLDEVIRKIFTGS